MDIPQLVAVGCTPSIGLLPAQVAAEAATGLGALIVLLTVAAQLAD